MDESYQRLPSVRGVDHASSGSKPPPNTQTTREPQSSSTQAPPYERIIQFDTDPSSVPDDLRNLNESGLSQEDAALAMADPYRGLTLQDLADAPPGNASGYPMHVLMQVAIQSSPQGRLRQSEIREYIMDRFPWYRHAKPTWKNTLRHALTNRSSFYKVPKPPNIPGRGCFWSYKYTPEPKRESKSKGPSKAVRGTRNAGGSGRSEPSGTARTDPPQIAGPSDLRARRAAAHPYPPRASASRSSVGGLLPIPSPPRLEQRTIQTPPIATAHLLQPYLSEQRQFHELPGQGLATYSGAQPELPPLRTEVPSRPSSYSFPPHRMSLQGAPSVASNWIGQYRVPIDDQQKMQFSQSHTLPNSLFSQPPPSYSNEAPDGLRDQGALGDDGHGYGATPYAHTYHGTGAPASSTSGALLAGMISTLYNSPDLSTLASSSSSTSGSFSSVGTRVSPDGAGLEASLDALFQLHPSAFDHDRQWGPHDQL